MIVACEAAGGGGPGDVASDAGGDAGRKVASPVPTGPDSHGCYGGCTSPGLCGPDGVSLDKCACRCTADRPELGWVCVRSAGCYRVASDGGDAGDGGDGGDAGDGG